jgi:hypothetical protein
MIQQADDESLIIEYVQPVQQVFVEKQVRLPAE